jgi:hypothetical protein
MSALSDKTQVWEREMYDEWSQAFIGLLQLPYSFMQASSQSKLRSELRVECTTFQGKL